MRMSYGERQAEWVKKYDVKVGDRVRLIRAASDEEDAWPNVWPCTADGWIGNILRVTDIDSHNIVCYNPGSDEWFGFPYFVLEKVMEHKDKDKEWTVSYGLKVKTGDPVLMRDDATNAWRYSVFSHKHRREDAPYPYYSAGIIAAICIPYVGNEHLVGTTDAYKAPEKPTKHKFVFGAKVKVKLSNGEEKEGVLTGYDFLGDDTPFEVVVQDKEDVFGRVWYWVKNVTYID